jgi:hypothetical protein
LPSKFLHRFPALAFFHCCVKQKQPESVCVTYWEIITRNLKKRGRSLGNVSAIDSNGQTICIADAHRGYGKRFVVRADEKLTAFVELESTIFAAALA